ncbi:MAG: RNA-binding protein [Paracoccaceae bacterium]|nr:MAG: RNA-binding protein [Paracoccaceae bacterium]
MTRGGRDNDRDDPERRCIVSGERAPKAGLVRFVVTPEGQVVPDVLARLPGRGIYVSADRVLIDRAVAKGLFARAARRPLTAPDGMADLIETQLVRRVTDLVSMARKAGDAVTGYEKVKDWLVKGTAKVLIQASDGSERGKSALRPPEGNGAFIGCLTAGEMGLSFGRERAIHGALAAGGLTTRIVEEAARLAGMRGVAQGSPVGGGSAGKDTKTT